MKHSKRWMIVVPLLAGLSLSACGQPPASTTSKPEPAHVEKIDGTELSRVILVPEAAKRLAIQTEAVREEQVTRKRTVGGEVLTAAGTSATNTSTTKAATSGGNVLVRVPLTKGDLGAVDRGQSAMILPLARVEGMSGVAAQLVDPPAGADAKAAAEALYYAVKGTEHSLSVGHRVRVELSLAGSGMQRTVIPYSAVIYDLHGATWVYTSPESFTLVREQVDVDYIAGNLAVLSKGPRVGTQIVAVGAAELYGTEFGVGH